MAQIVFDPFKNDSQSLQLGDGEGLTVENGLKSLSIYGNIEIAHNEKSHERVDELIELLTRVKAALPAPKK